MMIRIEGEGREGIVRPNLQMLDLVHRTHPALPERTYISVVANHASFFESDYHFHRSPPFYLKIRILSDNLTTESMA